MGTYILTTDTPVEIINETLKDDLIGTLGIRVTKTGIGEMEAIMPVSAAIQRCDGRLHGGANLVLAETIAGMGSLLLIDQREYDVLGMQVVASHTRSIKAGTVHARATIIHQGRQTHIWNVDLTDDDNRLISTTRVTNMVVRRNE